MNTNTMPNKDGNVDWQAFLQRWSAQIIEANRPENFTEEEHTTKWLGLPAATEDQILQTETRLEIRLPPSYRAFLKVTNGGTIVGTSIDQLWSVDDIDWLRNKHPHWLVYGDSRGLPSMPDNYYQSYTTEHRLYYRHEHVQATLEISDEGDVALLLLNPKVIHSDGEWEAWFLASWIPGVVRYRSFWDLMADQYHDFLGQLP